MKMQKLFIKTYGCQMNEYDSAKIADILAASCGLVTTETPSKADLIILNTCSVRAKASEKVFSELGRLRFLKKKNPNLVLAVGGCVSMQEQTNIFRRAPYVDVVFGPQTLHRLPKMYEKACNKEKRIIDITTPKIEKFDYFPTPDVKGAIAHVSIMEGCNKFCSYCIVPYTRGIEMSRPSIDILVEIKTLTDQGVKEIQLLGQNVNAYRDPNKKYTFSNLIHEIAKIKTIERINFTTSHPAEFGDDLITAFASEPKLTNSIHLPIQSGSNRILKLMRRGYTCEEYQKIIDKLRKIRPNIGVSTDIIVGFPTETEEDFADTMKIVQTINFNAAFSFIYSPRPNTPAAKMEDNIPLAQKKQRLLDLQNQLAIQSREYNKTMVGTVQKVLVVGRDKKKHNQFSGRTENNHIVHFTAPKDLLGEIVEVKIVDAMSNSLRGELL